MTTTTVAENAALANANEQAAEASVALTPTATLKPVGPFDNPNAKRDEQPYCARELRTAKDLLSMQVEKLLRDFERVTGAKISSCSLDYTGNVKTSLYPVEGTFVY